MPTVSEYLESDHRRLDAILIEVDRLVADAACDAAAARFADFTSGLGRHIDAEEHVLFPAFERLTGMVTGPTMVMRTEHVEIRRWMALAGARLAGADAVGYRAAVQGLESVLGPHNRKEEDILYPMCDRAAGTDGADDLVRRMQAVR
jgi:iron-sulfur cluster repair protein YtfE (RIC family)